MHACRYIGMDFCAAHGLTFGPIVRGWAVMAMEAEAEAQEVLMQQAQQRAKA